MNIGVDLVRISRFEKKNRHFIQRLLTPNEYKEYQCKENERLKCIYLASRFACKEAYLKAHGKGLFEIPFQKIEILNDSHGKPYFNDQNAYVSISHEDDYVIAFVVCI